MRPRDPYDRPLRVISVEDELVFLGEGPVHFSMTREAAMLTLQNLARALRSLPDPETLDGEAARTRGVILVVEDEPRVRKLAAAMLQDAGYAVIEAEGTRQALLALEARGEIHLLFADIQISGELSGLDLAGLVRTRWPRVRLLLTAGEDVDPVEELPPGGRFLAKPYLVTDVLRHIGELMAA